ncbi:IniB N-terminal domain-containing protein [Pseudonocardia pini]|uniref:IniB N-terminal domain-containing protein n=1 Tax=Pseudonocardia pini TaxID=2758030 RepID=UPI0015F0D261|nr:IniB N-terminal domain-containing protein [Pseudonocardia pini]
MTLLEFLLSLIGDEPQDLKLQQDFAANPVATLNKVGLEDLTADDVHDALVLVQDNQTVDFGDSDVSTGGNAIVVPPAPAFAGHHEAAHEGHSAIEYIQTYVTNTEVQDGDTVLGSPVKQVIDAGDDVEQVITTTTTAATGDGAVAAQGDIEESTVTTGDGNAIGDDSIAGDGNTVAYGAGDATSATVSGTTVSDGGAFSVTGPASGNHSTANSGNTTTTTTENTTTISDSNNTDTDISYSYESDDDSVDLTNVGNDTHVLSHNAVDVDA